ncbi:Xylulokinase [Flagellimonas maritima]|uniref:Xylulokinase n=1 Tax=Flagellimonas maritima TaxID=1383885 RepID=A0A2Z4LQH5_9FLAO|nr:FGGY family carbohydrate kinase [Allomuricauda aurantiaca]AWX43658.1 Xylulokinase [Allomuricauda aurantiaca]
MYYLGIDLGSSSVKIALVEKTTGASIAIVQEPENEMSIYAEKKGWAEQSPIDWWKHVCKGIRKIKNGFSVSENDIVGIGIAYQMHGLVIVDKKGKPLRPSIIWCDSRAVKIGERAYQAIGERLCDSRLLNSPGNFTASKLAWVQQNEPDVYKRIHKFMLPGDYIAYRLSNTINTTISGLSEGVFWDFETEGISNSVLSHLKIDASLIPDIAETFGEQVFVSAEGAKGTGLKIGTPIMYRAGDQPNNALSLNVFEPGEIAATGGTSGVVYAIGDKQSIRETSRVNNFAHVNYGKEGRKYIGKLLCINGAGILYKWLKINFGIASYGEMNDLASTVPIGSDGIIIIPFGNGSERMLENKKTGARLLNLDFNRHTRAHIFRAALEGIAFSYVYGMELLKNDGIIANAIRVGNDNLFRSGIFSDIIATLSGLKIEMYNTTGAIGAARACAIFEHGNKMFSSYIQNDYVKTFEPSRTRTAYETAYKNWKTELGIILNQ